MGQDLYLDRVKRKTKLTHDYMESDKPQRVMYWRSVRHIAEWFRTNCAEVEKEIGLNRYFVTKTDLKKFLKWTRLELIECRKEYFLEWIRFIQKRIDKPEKSWDHFWHKETVKKLPRIIRQYNKKYRYIFTNSY